MNRNFESGTFATGCNYWASHAGTHMWRNWSPETVSSDLKLLAAKHLNTLRVFPLWPDFQPLEHLYANAESRIIGFGEEPLPGTEAGRAGVNPKMMERFRFLADEAEKNGIRLIVGLITGWMSGQLFAPPAFQERNLLTDPLAIKWQVRFVRYFVRTLKDHPAIAAWDLGNECNCLAPLKDRSEAWNWSNAIASAIRLEDPARPVISGMHSLHLDPAQPWQITDQAELTDILTTHPYPLFTPQCNREPFNTMRNTLHATAESCLYADIGGKPCLPEEVGCLGPMVCSEERAAEYLRSALFSCWAHDLRGLLWWCAFDQDHLTHAPYDWVALERELGVFRSDGSPKPVADVFEQFNRTLAALPFGKLPPRRRDAVCILTAGQKQWEIAFAAFILAKQAGFDLVFHDAEAPLPDAELYLMPSIRLCGPITARRYRELLKKVEQGSRLLVTGGDGMLQPFEQVFGVKTDYRHSEQFLETFTIDGIGHEFSLPSGFRQKLLSTRAEVSGRNRDGDPILSRCACGAGQAWFLNLPLEEILIATDGAFYGRDTQPFYRIYRKFFQESGGERLIAKDHPNIGVTEHRLDADTVIGVLVNYCPEQAVTGFRTAPGWKLDGTLYGDPAEIPGNDAAIVRIRRIS
jgi:hypothetical protein